MPCQNVYLKDDHSIACVAFKLWLDCGNPKQGRLFDFRRRTRARFKNALRDCPRNKSQIIADTAGKKV